MVNELATEVSLLDHLRFVLTAARAAGIQVFFVPHCRWEPGEHEDWDHPNPSQCRVQERQSFAKGTWGGEWHPDFVPQPDDFVVREHWAQSGFGNTDLDFHLKQHGITHVVAVGVLANSCVESTGRLAMELGYHVTLVRDATAAFSQEHMHAAHDLNGPTFAHAILTTPELLAALPPAVS
jgi:nicotinamidase-related amidase